MIKMARETKTKKTTTKKNTKAVSKTTPKKVTPKKKESRIIQTEKKTCQTRGENGSKLMEQNGGDRPRRC